MSCVFQNIDPPSPSPPGECLPPTPLIRGEDTLAGWRRGWGGQYFGDADTALYSTYVSTYWSRHTIGPSNVSHAQLLTHSISSPFSSWHTHTARYFNLGYFRPSRVPQIESRFLISKHRHHLISLSKEYKKMVKVRPPWSCFDWGPGSSASAMRLPEAPPPADRGYCPPAAGRSARRARWRWAGQRSHAPSSPPPEGQFTVDFYAGKKSLHVVDFFLKQWIFTLNFESSLFCGFVFCFS